ncbi:TetR/AcrR family transcriptional regulator [Amycolatopsis sp. H20-H5]|uniref:TetR/AcrR family transcriptional regulator n=1 Tax=Amycolatopsis sp. H20-H5 TaxID=3046309 RepID=UPI002DBC02B9|nr:TetR/AcrR family transcriptional regulator [Amycolatopsis sp. H20-H5]MEC3976810.1 TetR/AcrR family transcriptional regulator [Amycolatopsis sp. H20-H5]
MTDLESSVAEEAQSESGRREHVLGAALETFARYGYKKASMEDVARAADISRPGLYFLFTSKQNLFRAAVTHALDSDVDAAKRCLSDAGRPLRDRLIEAFDLWTGRYVGPMAKEVSGLIETSPELLGPLVLEYPRRFLEMVTAAIAADLPPGRVGMAADMARTLVSTARGIKHEAAAREEFVARMTIGVDLFLPAVDHGKRHA